MPLKRRESSEICKWYEWLLVTAPLVHRFWYRSTRKRLIHGTERIAAARRPRNVRQRIAQRNNDRLFRMPQKRKFQVAAILDLTLKFAEIIGDGLNCLSAAI